MKLPDFRHDEELNRLKERMGMRRDEYGSISIVVAAGGLTVEEIKTLVTEGIDVGWDDLTHIANGTFAYKGHRVLLYIRDVSQYGNQTPQPRYHLATCVAISRMHNKGRGERYVVSTRTDGTFRVNIESPAGRRAEDLQLNVCRNCLQHLDFDEFNLLPINGRQAFVDKFLPEHFFVQYPISPHTRLPSYDSDGAPLNDYTADWAQVSARAKKMAQYRCSECRVDLSAPEHQKFLHVHHRDGNRWDNASHNLQVLCIGCHAEKPLHSHLRATPAYRNYQRLLRSLRAPRADS